VLIVDFENDTGESRFDAVLEHALERELTNSQFVNVVSRERIGDVLRLMRTPPDVSIDATLGREICLRDGEIRSLLAGRIEKLGSSYVLSTRVIDPASGAAVASVSEEAVAEDAILSGVRRVSIRLRETLGESLSQIDDDNQKLEKVTTPSLRALKLYSQAMVLAGASWSWETQGLIAELLEQAVTEDPAFATAHIYLAHFSLNLGRKERAQPHFEQAFELAEGTTERERYFILGSYYLRYLRDTEKAIAAYEALVRLYPQHYWGNHNLGVIYEQQNRVRESALYYARAADLRPHFFVSNIYAGHHVAIFLENGMGARRYILRAKNAAADMEEADRIVIALSGWLDLFSAFEHWLAGDLAAARSQALRLAAFPEPTSSGQRDARLEYVGMFYVTLGMLDEAEKLFQRLSRPSDRHAALATVALARGDERGLREHWRSATATLSAIDDGSRFDPFFLGRYGHLFASGDTGTPTDTAVTRQWVEGSSRRKPYIALAEGEQALKLGQTERAIGLLEEGLEWTRPYGFAAYFMGSVSLARAWEQQGNQQKALQVLEQASRDKARAYPFSGPFWMRAHFRLAELYRQLGRETDARKIEAELLELLKYADPDHAILQQLRSPKARKELGRLRPVQKPER
jgi:tetratricopeptide (TPR) repeat protein